MSTITDALKADKEIFFLVELDFDGWKHRISTASLSVPNAGGDDLPFEGIITNRIQVSSKLDLFTMRGSISSVNIEMANKNRFQDNEIAHTIDGGIGTVYVWSESLDWTDIEDFPVFKGYFHKNWHNKYKYSFTLDDPMYIKSKRLPIGTINSDTWPNMRTEGGSGSVAGKPEALIFGDWSKGVPLLCVDTAAFKYVVAAGVVKSTNAEYTATTENAYDKDGGVIAAGNYTFYPGGMDGQGNVVAYFDFTGDQVASEPLSCSIRAITDGSGRFTGTAGAFIEHPSDIVYYLLENFSNVLIADIDVESIRTMKSVLIGYKFASIINDTISSIDLVDRILSQCQCARIQRNGKVGVLTINPDGLSTATIKEFNLIGKTVKVTKTPLSQVCNNLKVFYGLNPTTGQWEGEFVRDRTNNPNCEKSYAAYGELPQIELQLADLHTEGAASGCADRYLVFNAHRHDVIECYVPPWDGFDIYEGDIAEVTVEEGPSLDSGGWTDERCLLLERRFDKGTIFQKWWRIGT